ncbi:alpha/beta hydrolase [Eubacterium sp. 1001713B170207_170306_E7]|uniref:alpha/beta fold hydrolase n=1 Tax=Eubacterium sp. 1001713B170207_170306_E7 TaxID=2787097 RepID=UPI0018974772|nr:alpha/beta hydrolase [Eubacterium sp. 1001713B170207_170306_E7]
MRDLDGWVASREAAIYYHVLGDGVPVVLLHGNGGDQGDFDSLIEYFLPEYQLILIDSRGHGRSGSGGPRLTTELMAGDVLAVMDHLGLARAVLFGFSDGANIALELAAQKPERVLALVAVSGNTYPGGMRSLPRLFIRLAYRFWHFMERLGLPVGSRAQRYGLMCWSPRLTEEALSRIDLPVLLLAGTRDLVKSKHSRQMEAAIPGADLVLLKGAGHMSLFRRTGTYMKQILDFLESCGL